MGLINKLWRFFLVCVLLLTLTGGAMAHNIAMAAVVSFSPPELRPGASTLIQVRLLDAYRSPIQHGRVGASLWRDGGPEPGPVGLKEAGGGLYEGALLVPGNGTAIIRIEAGLPDGVWAGQLPVSVGPEEPPANELGIEMLHQEAGPGGPTGTSGTAGAGVLELGAVVLFAAVLGWLTHRVMQAGAARGGGAFVTGWKLRYLQAMAIGLPALTVALFEYLRHRWLEPRLPPGVGNIVGGIIVAAGVYGFVSIFAGIIRSSSQEAFKSRERTAVVLERQRIAREMHDSVAQTLFFLSVKLKDVGQLIGEGRGGEARSELQTVGGHLDEAYAKVRAVIADLKEQAELQEFGDALRRAAAETGERLGLRVSVEVEGAPEVSPAARSHLLAIVQEAMTNAQRHGQARRVTVRLQARGEGLLLQVSDDGKGFDGSAAPPPGKYGLEIMAERARMAGGGLRVESSAGRGTRITVRLPEGEE